MKYTEGTLIADMASIAKYVTDPEVKAILKQKDDGKKGEHGGIGTTATRASIIEKLKERGYMDMIISDYKATMMQIHNTMRCAQSVIGRTFHLGPALRNDPRRSAARLPCRTPSGSI